jgi:hypothetical protein
VVAAVAALLSCALVSGEETDDILPALLDKLTAEKVGGTGRIQRILLRETCR